MKRFENESHKPLSSNDKPNCCDGASPLEANSSPNFLRQLGAALRQPQTLGALAAGIVVSVGFLALHSIPLTNQFSKLPGAVWTQAKKASPAPTVAASQSQVPAACC